MVWFGRSSGRFKLKKLALILVFVLSIAFSAQAFQGKVVAVIDGDTIDVLYNGEIIKIRLNGIDCPESGQEYGYEAKLFSREMVLGKVVEIDDKGKDKYGRTIANVNLSDGTSLNKELVKSGYAWWYKKYSDDQELSVLEKVAAQNKKGLWAGRGFPEAPWDWRKNSKAYYARTAENSANSQPITQINPVKTTRATIRGDRQIYTGPRGGRYHYSKNGKKVYERKR